MDDRDSVPDADADLPDDEDAEGEDLFDENVLQECVECLDYVVTVTNLSLQ
jgi:hypothetical protein